MYLEKNAEKKWLIKSENKILGPYSFDQIIDLIRKKQLSLIDEIRDPETRWLYVRENAEFKGIVEEMRKEIDARQESTKTYQSVSKTVDESLMKTQTEHQFTDINLENSEPEPVKDIDIVKEILSNAAEYKAPRNNSSGEKAKVYGVKSDTKIQAALNLFASRVVVGTICILILVVGGFFAYTYVQQRGVQKREEELAQQARKYEYLGLYPKAAEYFSKLPTAARRKLLPDLLEMFPLLSRMDLVSREDLVALKSTPGLTSEQRAQVEMLNFLQSVEEQNYSSAQEALVRATTADPASPLIKENEGLLYLKKGDFLNAYKAFSRIFEQERSGRYLFGMVLAYQGMQGSDKFVSGRDTLKAIQSYTTAFYDYRKELLLAQIHLADEQKDEIAFKVAIADFLNTPCQLSSRFIKHPLLLPNAYQWKDLADIRSSVSKILTEDNLIMYQLHDLLESSQRSAATEFVTNNSERVLSPQTREQMRLLLFDSQDRYKEAVLIEKSPNFNRDSELNQLLVGQNKLKIDAAEDISAQLDYLKGRKITFYHDWLYLDKLIRQNATAEIRTFLRDNFITIENFSPVYEAKSLVN